MGIEITKKAWKKISKTVKDTKKQWGYLLALNGRLTKLEDALGFCPGVDKKVLEEVWEGIENDLNDIKLIKPNIGDTLSDCIIEKDECDCQDYEAGLVSTSCSIHNENPIERGGDFIEPDNDGLKQEYVVEKADGSEIDHDGFYFVLKIGGKLENPFDHANNKASIKALYTYADSIGDILPKLSQDIINKLNKYFITHEK